MRRHVFRDARLAQAQQRADLLRALGAVPAEPTPEPTSDPIAAMREAQAAEHAANLRALGVELDHDDDDPAASD